MGDRGMRTFWMRMFVAGYVGGLLLFVYFLFTFVLPNADQPEAGAFLPVFVVFIALFALLAAAGVLWPSAPRRRWFWLLGAVPALLVLLLFTPQIAYDLTHPTAPTGFVASLVALASTGAAIAGGVMAFRDVSRAAAATAAPSTRARSALTALAGIFIGASLTSIAAGSAAGGGGNVGEAPTATATLQTTGSRFVEASLAMKNGEVLGVFVINRDGLAHSFDIDSLNIHVALPPNSTTAVAIKPTGAGQLEFYCGVPGHRPTMTGFIVVQ